MHQRKVPNDVFLSAHFVLFMESEGVGVCLAEGVVEPHGDLVAFVQGAEVHGLKHV